VEAASAASEPQDDSEQDSEVVRGSQEDEDLEENKAAPPPAPNRRCRASTQTSDGSVTFEENGHHKPTYKHTKACQKSSPYQLTRAHSAQSCDSGANCSMEVLYLQGAWE
jgi:hypothetical protein